MPTHVQVAVVLDRDPGCLEVLDKADRAPGVRSSVLTGVVRTGAGRNPEDAENAGRGLNRFTHRHIVTHAVFSVDHGRLG